MAKNLKSVSCMTILLFVILMASTEIQKSKAQPICPRLIGECGPEPYEGTDADCLACCVTKYAPEPVRCGRVEEDPDHDHEPHCHCYGAQTSPPSPPPPVCPTLIGECGPEPFTGTDPQCLACCLQKFGTTVRCGRVEEDPDHDHEPHCHCYGA